MYSVPFALRADMSTLPSPSRRRNKRAVLSRERRRLLRVPDVRPTAGAAGRALSGAALELNHGTECDRIRGGKSGQCEGRVDRKVALNLRGQPCLALGEVGGLLAVGVIFALRAAFLADGLIPREMRGDAVLPQRSVEPVA